MTIRVKQRQYGISIHGHAQTSLVTEDIWTCTGLVGVDKKSGTVFLAHFDLPTTAKSLPKIIDELKKHTNDLSGFKLYMVAGINPAIAAIFGGLAISCVFFQAWAFASAFIVCAGLLSMTRFAIRDTFDIVKIDAVLRLVNIVEDFIVAFDFMLDFMKELSKFYLLLLGFNVTLNFVLLTKPKYILAKSLHFKG